MIAEPRQGLLVVVNPVSGRGRGAEVLSRLREPGCVLSKVLQALKAGNPDGWTIVQTDSKGEWKAQARTNIGGSGGAAAIAVIGGDGTFSELAQVYYECLKEKPTASKPPVLLIPAGRGNDLARSVYGTEAARGATELLGWLASRLERWRVSAADLVLSEHRIFVNMASIGYGGRVVERAQNRKAFWSKSSLVYQIEGALALLGSSTVSCTVEADGREVYRGPFFGAFVGGGKANGRGLFWNRNAALDDGCIDGLVFPRPGVLEMSRSLAAVKKVAAPVFSNSSFRGKRFVFRCDQPVALELDGEYVGASATQEFQCLPGQFLVVTPESSQ